MILILNVRSLSFFDFSAMEVGVVL
jgi:hypothetical protein